MPRARRSRPESDLSALSDEQAVAPERVNATARTIAAAVTGLPVSASRIILAVSGGRDSMALLQAMHRWAPSRIAAVATFDHGTGAYARDAAALVVRTASALGLPVETERAERPGHSEAAWRAARWAFLHRVADQRAARVATAHTREDQLETVVQRILRGTGARGLAGLAADGPIVRPWLDVPRDVVAAWASAAGVSWLEDPANRDRRHQRVQLRHDLLPAITRVDPGFGEVMLALGEKAAQWRRDVDVLVDAFVDAAPVTRNEQGEWLVPREALAGWSAASLGVVWPALLARGGIVLNGEGTARLVRFTIGSARAGELQLPGGAAVVRRGTMFEVRAASAVQYQRQARSALARTVSAGAPIPWPGWRIVPVAAGEEIDEASPHAAAFPASAELQIRTWQHGDRIRVNPQGAARRISRYLAETGVPRLDRSGWPVVLCHGQVVWVPGICRGPAAPHRSGRSDFIWYRSERDFG